MQTRDIFLRVRIRSLTKRGANVRGFAVRKILSIRLGSESRLDVFFDYILLIILYLYYSIYVLKVHSIQYCRRPETSQTSLTLRRWLLLIKRKKSRIV